SYPEGVASSNRPSRVFGPMAICQTIFRSSIQYTSIIAHGSDNTLHLRTVSCRTNSPTTDLQFWPEAW
ncbi:hypothetical protein BGY98DRAFT_1011100, partial [Russula aff. rugulosa BPL654]